MHILFLTHGPERIWLNSFLDIICFLYFKLEFCYGVVFNFLLILLFFRPKIFRDKMGKDLALVVSPVIGLQSEEAQQEEI